MATVGIKQVQDSAKELLKAHPSGLRFTHLVNLLMQRHPDANHNMVWTQVGSLPKTCQGEIFKPSRGIYQLVALAGKPSTAFVQPPAVTPAYECDFYESFAQWLRDDLEEATEAVSL